MVQPQYGRPDGIGQRSVRSWPDGRRNTGPGDTPEPEEDRTLPRVILAIKRGTYIRIENMYSHTIPPDEDEYGFRTE